MKTRVEWSGQVASFVNAQSPEPRHKLRLAIRALADGGVDTRALVDLMSGYQRLRLGPYRVIFREKFDEGGRVVLCIFAERRAVVYEIFTEMLLADFS